MARRSKFRRLIRGRLIYPSPQPIRALTAMHRQAKDDKSPAANSQISRVLGAIQEAPSPVFGGGAANHTAARRPPPTKPHRRIWQGIKSLGARARRHHLSPPRRQGRAQIQFRNQGRTKLFRLRRRLPDRCRRRAEGEFFSFKHPRFLILPTRLISPNVVGIRKSQRDVIQSF